MTYLLAATLCDACGQPIDGLPCFPCDPDCARQPGEDCDCDNTTHVECCWECAETPPVRPLRPQDTVLFCAAIVVLLADAALAKAAHTVGWHRWCNHPPRHHTHKSPFPRTIP